MRAGEGRALCLWPRKVDLCALATGSAVRCPGPSRGSGRSASPGRPPRWIRSDRTTCTNSAAAPCTACPTYKGYSLCVLTELLAAFNGGSLPSVRSRVGDGPEGEKRTCNFLFQAWHPEALAPATLAAGRPTAAANVAAVAQDILGPGNEGARLPGFGKHAAARRSAEAGGLLFTAQEVAALARIAAATGVAFDPGACARYAAD